MENSCVKLNMDMTLEIVGGMCTTKMVEKFTQAGITLWIKFTSSTNITNDLKYPDQTGIVFPTCPNFSQS